MEIEDYESMRLEHTPGAWSGEPFLGQPLTADNVKQLRTLRRYVAKKSTDGDEIYRLLEDNDPTDPDFLDDESSEEEFTAACNRIIKLMGRTKVADNYIHDEEDILNWYDELRGNYDLESHVFEAEQDLINHYLANNCLQS